MKTAHIIMADYTDNFEPSVQAISKLSEAINGLPNEDKKFFKKLKNNDDWYIQKIFESINSKNSGCIHGYGYRLASIYITTYNNIKKHLSINNKSDIDINSLGIFEH